MIGLGLGLPLCTGPAAPEAPLLDLNFVTGDYRQSGAEIALDSVLSFSRASTATYWPASGTMVSAGNDFARIDHAPGSAVALGLLIEAGATNKCAINNHDPSLLAGLTLNGDPAATLTVVDDSVALATAGLSSVCTTGMVYKLDNSAGSAFATVSISGTTGNTIDHAASVWWREVAGYGVSLYLSGTYLSPAPITTSYAKKVSVQTPASTGAKSVIYATAGAVVYFILNQLEEGTQSSSEILTNGASATREADSAGLITLSGAYSVTLTYDDDSSQNLANTVLSNGWWPTLSRPRVKRILID